MDGAWVAAICSTIGVVITGVFAWVNRRDESRDKKAEIVEAAQAELITMYKADAEAERERRRQAQAEADRYEQETDRLRDLLRHLIHWIDGGATPPPPDVSVKDLWSSDD